MILIPQLPEIVVEQKIAIISGQNFISSQKSSNKLELQKSFSFTIKRFLKDDLFSVILNGELINKSGLTFWTPNTNVNNEDKSIHNYTDYDFQVQMNNFEPNALEINRFLLGNIPFQNLKMSVFGMSGGKQNVVLNSFHTLTNWEIGSFNKTITSDFDHVLHFKIPKQIKITTNIKDLKLSPKDNPYFYKITYPGNYEIEFQYLHLILKANRPNWHNPTQSLVDIYGYDDTNKNSNIWSDIETQTAGLLKSTSVRSGLKTEFQYDYDPNRRYLITSGKQAAYLGSIKALESTYYDYQKQDVVKGFSENSILNDQIPYNFSGLYRWELNFDLNKVINNFNWNLYTKIDKALLNPYDGLVKLKITSSNEKIMKKLKYTLDNEALKIIREQKDISLAGIEQLAKIQT